MSSSYSLLVLYNPAPMSVASGMAQPLCKLAPFLPGHVVEDQCSRVCDAML